MCSSVTQEGAEVRANGDTTCPSQLGAIAARGLRRFPHTPIAAFAVASASHNMLNNILIPIDGSPISMKAARAGIAVAKRTGAKITVCYAIDPIPYGFYADGAPSDDRMKVELERRARQAGERHAETVAKAAESGRQLPLRGGSRTTRRRHRRHCAKAEMRCNLYRVPWLTWNKTVPTGKRHKPRSGKRRHTGLSSIANCGARKGVTKIVSAAPGETVPSKLVQL